MMFKLAFHTYEALSNKLKVEKRMKNLAKDKEQTRKVGKSTRQDKIATTTDWDLISNMSGESHYTVAGGAGNTTQFERKLQLYSESLDVKLNVYLKKW